METEEKQAVMTALNKLVNFRAYDSNKLFLGELYQLIEKDVARDINFLFEQLCQSLGTTIVAELNKPYKFEYEPLRYKAIPEWDVDMALEIAINNVMIASTDLDRMLRNKRYADRGTK